MENIFEDLFVLELANNHLGSVRRGLKIIDVYNEIVRRVQVRAAIKLQFRDVANFIHPEFRDNEEIRYIRKTRQTRLTNKDYAHLVSAIRNGGCIPMATPFDEASVDLCVQLQLPIIKIASSCINDWQLIERIAHYRVPVIASNGGANLQDMDALVEYFNQRAIPLAINHCVSIYPSEDHELELNQIDFLRCRYPDNAIGFSTHEYHDWRTSIIIAYAKGARTFERHIDIPAEEGSVSPYCSLPEQIEVWFQAYKTAVQMCGASGTYQRNAPDKEIRYLDALVRGLYARRDLPAGHRVQPEQDLYAAIPLQMGQISCREEMHGSVVLRAITKDNPILIDDIDHSYDANTRELIMNRGLRYAGKK